MAGYSGTPLARKLGIKVGTRLAPISAPEEYVSLLAPVPAEVTFLTGISRNADIVHLFVTSRAALSAHLKRCVGKMRADTVIWISWPKKAAKLATDLTEDVIRAAALPLGLVDIKVCAIDETWSGLKLVVRKERRASWG
jgi:hypothetical protein